MMKIKAIVCVIIFNLALSLLFFSQGEYIGAATFGGVVFGLLMALILRSDDG